MRLGAITAGLGVLGAGGGWLLSLRGAPPAPLSVSPTPVIVELFSSEGCSSCPPADAYLLALDRAQPVAGVAVIAFEEHVDYWDRLGWRDPFGSPAFSARQQAYAQVLTDHRVFTPEIVFDGHLVMPGGDEDAARAMMQASAREPKAQVALRREGFRLAVDVRGVPGASQEDPAEVIVAITESGLVSDVGTGENAGRRLAHAPVVRRLQSLGRVTGETFHAETPVQTELAWKPRALHFVAFVQLATSRRIAGAAAL